MYRVSYMSLRTGAGGSGVYKVMNCVNGERTCPVLVGKLGQLGCHKCSDTKMTVVGSGRLLGMCQPRNRAFIFTSSNVVRAPAIVLRRFPSRDCVFHGDACARMPICSFSSFHPVRRFYGVATSRTIEPRALGYSSSLVVERTFSSALLRNKGSRTAKVERRDIAVR